MAQGDPRAFVLASTAVHYLAGTTGPAVGYVHQPGSWGEIGPDYDSLADKIMDRLYGQHAGKAVVACRHCGQWGARYCSCRHCGAPID